jgi:cobalt-precorrin 5A hydrolase/precorrin-3B C17-methyltransferase
MSSESRAISQKSEVRISDTAICYITVRGFALAKKLAAFYPNAGVIRFKPELIPELWRNSRSLVFIMATGIVVRVISPLIKDKKTDPAVIVVDEEGKYAVSLLSGHLGGANEKAKEIAGFLGGEAVITTASDIGNLTSIDIWARDNDLVIEDWNLLSQIATKLVDLGSLNVYDDSGMTLPPEFRKVADSSSADMLITHDRSLSDHRALYLRPRDLVVGIGCNSRTSAEEIEAAVQKALADHKLSFQSVLSVATIDIKAKEPGLIAFAEKYDLGVATFTADELNSAFQNPKSEIRISKAALKATGAKAVAEPAALLGAKAEKLLVNKQKIGNVTVAVAGKKGGVMELDNHAAKRTGKIYVVGTGPGNIDHITPYAQKAIRGSDAIVGYGTYLDLIQDLIVDKQVVATGMTQEIDRCRKAIELASEGRTVAVISGGDPGIYAMAGLVLELLRNRSSEFGMQNPEIEVIPGVSALNAAAALLGAPLMHDFASISLSDRLTQWETIEKRLDAAAMADFVIVLYNPRSRGRTEQIIRARDIIMKRRLPDTPVGIVRGAMRENESVVITNLGKMLEEEIDMQTSIIIGNSNTFVWNNLMITPRGYEKKQQYPEI